MNFQFDKYQGAGNDFIILEDRAAQFPDRQFDQIQKLCDRHFGIGADGLILLRTSERADFKMLYFNADGRPSSLCGNGSRCVYAFAHQHGWVGAEGTFETSDGLHKASLTDEGWVCVHMGEVNGIEERGDALFLDTGSPHHLEFVEELASIDVKQKGRAIRYGAPYFEEGSNVNFVQQLAPDTFKIRTYERGVEDETLACGTGAVAAAIAAYHRQLTSLNIVNIDAAGGKLKVSFSPQAGKYKDIQLEGPATFVFSGNIKIG